MAHPLDLDQPGAGDRLRGRPPAGGPDHLVDGAVDHQGRSRDRPQLLGAVGGGDDRAELAPARPDVVAAVVAAGGALADVGLVAGEAGRADQPEDLGGAVDVALPVARWRPEQVLVDREGGLPVPAAAGRRHDRGQRANELGVLGGEDLADHPAHRGTDDVGGGDAELADQARGVLGHVGERVLLGADPAAEHLAHRRRPEVEVGRAADVAVVEADDVEAAVGELLAELLVPGDHLGRQAHHQHHRGVGGVAEGLVAEGDPAPDVAELLAHPLRMPLTDAISGGPVSQRDLANVLATADIRGGKPLAWPH